VPHPAIPGGEPPNLALPHREGNGTTLASPRRLRRGRGLRFPAGWPPGRCLGPAPDSWSHTTPRGVARVLHDPGGRGGLARSAGRVACLLHTTRQSSLPPPPPPPATRRGGMGLAPCMDRATHPPPSGRHGACIMRGPCHRSASRALACDLLMRGSCHEWTVPRVARLDGGRGGDGPPGHGGDPPVSEKRTFEGGLSLRRGRPFLAPARTLHKSRHFS